MARRPAVYADLTVAENIRFFARVLDAPEGRDAEVIDVVGLGGAASQLVRDLSGGQRARVSLATALVGKPQLLVLDEPTVGLDPVLRRDLWNTFHELAGEGVALLVSSHLMDEAERCDELVLMRDGRVLTQATPVALLERTGAKDVEHVFLHLVEST